MQNRNQFSFSADVWRWPGASGWHFVNIDKALSEKVRKQSKPYGAGFVKVRVTLGSSTWITALFPQKISSSYILSIKKSIRQKEDVWEGNHTKLSFTLV